MVTGAQRSVEEGTPEAREGPGAGSRLGRFLPVLGWTLASGALAMAAAAWNLRLWDADLRVPLFGFSSDASLTTLVTKGALEHGWIWSNPSLGAPFGANFFDYPAAFGDTLTIAVMKLMGVVSDDPILVVNAFFLLGFPAAAICAFWVLRALGIGSWVALVCALLFAVIPGHFMRSIAHLGLATYWAVPLGAWMVFGAAGLNPLLARREERTGLLSWASPRTGFTALFVVLLGLSGLYYSLFAVALIVLVGLIYFVASRSWSTLGPALAVAAVLFGVVVAQQLPAILYAHENGLNAAVAKRIPSESETYGLKLTQVLLPRADHRLASFSSLGREYASATPAGEGFDANLGTLLGLALVVAIVWALAAAAGAGARAGPGSRLAAASGVASLIAILLATVGGGGAIVAFTVSSQIRGWNRISVYLAFFAAVVLALVLAGIGRWLSARRVPTVLCGGALAVVAVLGVLDQTSSPKIDFVGIKEAWRSQVRFVNAIGERVPAGSEILELPYVPFPENPPVVNMADYDLAAPYLADRNGLRWSYGAVKGRPSDWADDLSRRPTREVVYGAAAAGFAGIYLDRDGYADDGRRVVRQIRAVVGPGNEIQSSDGRAVFFDLTELRAKIAASSPALEREQVSDAVLRPVSVEPGPGFSEFEVSGGERRSWGDRRASLRIENPSASPVRATLTAFLAGPSSTLPTRITVRCPGAPARRFSVTSVEPRRLRAALDVPAGGASCTLLAVGPEGPVTAADPRPKYQLVVEPRVSTAGLAELRALSRAGR